MKIAITSICGVLLLYVASQLFLHKNDTPAPAAPLVQQGEKKLLPASTDSEPATQPIKEAASTNDAIQPTESIREHYIRLYHELEQRKSEMSPRRFNLETTILNAKLSLAENPETTPPSLTEAEKALIEDFKSKRKAGAPNPGDTILASLDESSSPAMYFIAGNLFSASGDIDNAIDFYATVLDTDQEISETLRRRTNNNLGIMLVKTGDFERSKPYLQNAIYLTKEPNTTLHGLLGLAEFKSGNLNASEYHYKKAISIDPDVYDWQAGLAKNLLNQDKYQEAIDLLKSMIENPSFEADSPKS